MYHITERAGVMLHVSFDKDDEGRVCFHSIRVMDGEYRPVGPDLTPLFENTVSLDPPVVGEIREGEDLRSIICGELQ